MSQEVCKPMKNHKEDEFTLLGSVFRGLSVYFNYTGISECLDILSSSAPTLGEKGWNYQVIYIYCNTYSVKINLI